MKSLIVSTIERTDVRTRDSAEAALSGSTQKNIFTKLIPFLGPAFIASVAYVDPGNFATNIQGGSEFGYTLLWVILVSNLMAMLIQALAAKLGIATGRNLAEQCREHFRKPVAFGMWALMEVVAMATDLAEFLGAAIGFNLLFGFPLIVGGIITGICTFLILGLQRYGFRPLEIVITALVSIIALCYVVETVLDRPDSGVLLYHTFVPQFQGTESILIATGILGATVMPHAIFLHSALTQQRIVVRDPCKLRKLFRFEIFDVTIAMGIASLVNMTMLIMAAATFHKYGLTNVATIEEAHITLQPLLGKAAGWIFAVSLLASGLSSSTVGTSAGQIIMQGFIHRHIPIWLRRLVTMVPSMAVIAAGLDPTRTLVISQVVLSFGLPFAIIPLIKFTRDRNIMGILVNKRVTTLAVSAIAILIILLNVYLISRILLG
ncbi:MAG TPA: Nramp family divalent metal transporter [Candidatus Acidoferrales bacterium]|nr:Nramp family divalent metal transporter [Candidatus Acidoferrales bacterium]